MPRSTVCSCSARSAVTCTRANVARRFPVRPLLPSAVVSLRFCMHVDCRCLAILVEPFERFPDACPHLVEATTGAVDQHRNDLTEPVAEDDPFVDDVDRAG